MKITVLLKAIVVFCLCNSTLADQLHKHPTVMAIYKHNNQIRETKGLPPHRLSLQLTQAAQDQAVYLAQTHDFEHITKNNGSPGTRAARYGYQGIVRENLGRAPVDKQWTIDVAFRKWRESESHWQSIIGDFKEVGFGYAIAQDGTQYWVALYGKPF